MTAFADQHKWILSAILEAAEETLPATLGVENVQFMELSQTIEADLIGMALALSNAEYTFQFAIMASSVICQQLAKLLFVMEEDDEDLPTNDVLDALGEIVNILVGGIKRHLPGDSESYDIGLPVEIQSASTVLNDGNIITQVLQIGTFQVSLVTIIRTSN